MSCDELTEYEQTHYDELLESWFKEHPTYKDTFELYVLEQWQLHEQGGH